MDFITSIDRILPHEGGYVNDPDDRGGETNFGLSKRAHPDLDIPNLTRSSSIEIYRKRYWEKFRVKRYPSGIRLIMFDMIINMGIKGASKVLQRAINYHPNTKVDLIIDGSIGDMSMTALSRISLEPDRLRAFRVKYYSDLIRRNPSQMKYFFGWFKRTIEI